MHIDYDSSFLRKQGLLIKSTTIKDYIAFFIYLVTKIVNLELVLLHLRRKKKVHTKKDNLVHSDKMHTTRNDRIRVVQQIAPLLNISQETGSLDDPYPSKAKSESSTAQENTF